MGLSETIVAAIIGALATMGTAIFQLIRNRAPEGSKPKKNRMRSLVATIALMIGCVVGGYAWSSLKAVSAKEDLKSTMKAEFAEQFAALAARQSEAARDQDSDGGAIAARHGETGSSEALAHLPPCHIDAHPDEVGPVTCSDRVAQTISLCASVPSAALTTNVRIQARVPKSESPWQERDASSPTLGSLRLGEATAEYPVSADQRSVCLDVSNRSVEDTLAVRLIVDYAFDPKPPVELTAATPSSS
ncbi:MAG: hypothetical protein K0Q92_1806 [Steroidobacteraceae bacterium]|jgi:hypothetical protein|nr:hypothetical protein [Steroidobacteraceae bacterium]